MRKSYLQIWRLADIHHMVASGTLVTPAFQRGFVWTFEMVKQLFTSINDGYPIGMLLAVEEDSERFEPSRHGVPLIPEVTRSTDGYQRTLWILDGSQRLAAIYHVLFGDRPEFGLLYDLKTKQFLLPTQWEGQSTAFHISALFRRAFMDVQARLAQLEGSDLLLNELAGLHKRFMSYEIPIQIVSGVDDRETVEMFMRLNSSGTALNETDVARARTYIEQHELPGAES